MPRKRYDKTNNCQYVNQTINSKSTSAGVRPYYTFVNLSSRDTQHSFINIIGVDILKRTYIYYVGVKQTKNNIN